MVSEGQCGRSDSLKTGDMIRFFEADQRSSSLSLARRLGRDDPERRRSHPQSGKKLSEVGLGAPLATDALPGLSEEVDAFKLGRTRLFPVRGEYKPKSVFMQVYDRSN